MGRGRKRGTKNSHKRRQFNLEFHEFEDKLTCGINFCNDVKQIRHLIPMGYPVIGTTGAKGIVIGKYENFALCKFKGYKETILWKDLLLRRNESESALVVREI